MPILRMLVVSDTSPLSNLAVIGRLELVREEFGALCVPPAVARELTALSHAGGQLALRAAFAAGWLAERPLPAGTIAPLETSRLDVGEAEAIVLARAVGADRLLIDEKEGREVAEKLGIKFTGAIGILLRARQAGKIPSLADEIERLRNQAYFFVDAALETKALALVGE